MRQHLGKEGEVKASKYLINKGLNILHSNWKSGYCEIDIIAKDQNMLVIVEVKTRSSDHFGNPSDAVKSNKHRNLFKATEEYISQSGFEGEIRFDIIAIYLENGEWIIEHYEDAFYPN